MGCGICGPTKRPIVDIDIWRAAALLVKRHREAISLGAPSRDTAEASCFNRCHALCSAYVLDSPLSGIAGATAQDVSLLFGGEVRLDICS